MLSNFQNFHQIPKKKELILSHITKEEESKEVLVAVIRISSLSHWDCRRWKRVNKGRVRSECWESSLLSHNAYGAPLALRVPSGLNTLPAPCVAIHRTYSTTLTHDLIDYRSLHSLTSHSSLKVPPSLSSSEVVIMLIPNPKGK